MPTIAQRYDPAFPIADLAEHPANPRRGDEAAIGESMAAHGFYGAVLAQASTGRIIAGNHRARVARARGEETVPVIFLDVDDDRARRILLVDNRSNDRAGYDDADLAQLLAELAASDDALVGTGWSDDELAALLADLEAPEREGHPAGSLADRFLAPPFSVLDGRSGYWRERKARWLRWGLASRRGRPANMLGEGLVPARDMEAAIHRNAGLRSGEGRSPNLLSMSDTVRSGGYDGGDAWGWAGTSIFDPVLAELMISWFCPPGGRIADPFCGGSVRGAVASALGHAYAGYDLRPEQVAANETQADDLALDPRPDWRVGDARDAVWDGPFDMLLTCPPYWSLERYSDDAADLSTTGSLDDFAVGLTACLRPALAALAPDSFAVVVLGAMRDGHRLIDLPGLGAEILAAAGLVPYNDFVLLTPLASAALRAGRMFANRKPVPVHQRVIVAAKGDPLAAAARCGPIDVLDDEALLAGWLEPE